MKKTKINLALVKPRISGYVQKMVVESMADGSLYNATMLRKIVAKDYPGIARQSIHYTLKALHDQGVISRFKNTNYYSLNVAKNEK